MILEVWKRKRCEMEVLKGEMENLVYGDNFTFLM